LRVLPKGKLQLPQIPHSIFVEQPLIKDVLAELGNTFVEASPTSFFVLAVKAHKAEARLFGAFVHGYAEPSEQALHKIAELHLLMELHAGAVVQDIAHRHVIEGCVLLESLVAIIRHLDDNTFRQTATSVAKGWSCTRMST